MHVYITIYHSDGETGTALLNRLLVYIPFALDFSFGLHPSVIVYIEVMQPDQFIYIIIIIIRVCNQTNQSISALVHSPLYSTSMLICLAIAVLIALQIFSVEPANSTAKMQNDSCK